MKRFKYNKQEVIELVWERSVNRLVDIMLFYIDDCAEYVRDGRGEYKNKKPYEYQSCIIECFEKWYLSSTFDEYNSQAINKLEQELSGNPSISPERRENFLRDVTNLMADVRRYGIRYVRGEATKQEYDELKNREVALNIIAQSLSRKNEPFYEKTIVELFMQLLDEKEAGKTKLEMNPEGAKPKIGDDELTDTESNIVEALGDAVLTGPELLKKAGYDYSSHYRTILSNLVKRRILRKTGHGYQLSQEI